MAEATSVGSLYYDLNIDDKNLSKQLDAADENVKGFGKSVENTGEQLSANLSKAAKGFAIVGAGLTLISKQATDFTVDRVKEAKTLGREIGVSTQEASRLTAALSHMGLSAEQASSNFGIFSKNITASTEGSTASVLATQKLNLQIEQTKKSIAETSAEIAKNGDKSGKLNDELKILNNTLASQQEQLNSSIDNFAKLGITTKDATGKQKDFNTLLFEVADKFKTMPDGIEKTSIALGLFGRSGKDMIKILNLGGDGIKDLEKNADALGLTLKAETIDSVAKYIAATKEMKEQQDALKIVIGTATLPVLTTFKQTVNDVTTALVGSDGPIKTLTVDVLAFGGPVFGAAGGLLQLTANAVQAKGPIVAVGSALFSLQALSIAGWVALVVADLMLLVKAANTVKDAFAAVMDAQQASNNLQTSSDLAIAKIQQSAKAGTISKDKASSMIKSISTDASTSNQQSWWQYLPGFATGIKNFTGGLARVHGGEVLANLPKGTDVIPKNQVASLGSNTVNVNIGTVQNQSDADYIINRISRNFERVAQGVSPA